MSAEWVGVILTTALTVVGLYLVHSYARQTRVRLADARREAYAELWSITYVARPTRLETKGWGGVLSEHERESLYDSMTSWYFRNGNGMLLEKDTREVYLTAKRNLICDADDIEPSGILNDFPAGMSIEDRRGCLSIRQLSLLRTQMKSDLAIYGEPFVNRLASHERAFLRHCGVSLWRRPWRGAARGTPEPENCGCSRDA